MILIHQNEEFLHIVWLQTKLAKVCSHFRLLQSLNEFGHHKCAAAVCIQGFKDLLCSDEVFPFIIKLLLHHKVLIPLQLVEGDFDEDSSDRVQ